MNTTDPTSKTRPLRVLLVDDEPEILELLQDELQIYGHTAIIAHSGDAGYAKFLEAPIDLVISDIQMSPGDGISLLKRIRSNHPTQPIVVLMSGYTKFTPKEVIQLGAEGIVEKPFDRQKLHQFLALVTERLERTDSRRFERIAVDLPIRVEVLPQNPIECRVKNISKAGVFIQVAESQWTKIQLQRLDAIQYEVKTSLDPEAASIRGQGQIRWVENTLGFGMEFTKVVDQSLAMLYDYLDRLVGTLLHPLTTGRTD